MTSGSSFNFKGQGKSEKFEVILENVRKAEGNYIKFKKHGKT